MNVRDASTVAQLARWRTQAMAARAPTFLSCLVSVYASSSTPEDVEASYEGTCGRLSPRGRGRGIRARRVRVAKERLHARRFFVRQTQFGPHWGSRQSTQYQFSAGTDRMPSHLTWHVFLHVPARDASPIDQNGTVWSRGLRTRVLKRSCGRKNCLASTNDLWACRAARSWRERALRPAAAPANTNRCSGLFAPCTAPALEIPGGAESLGKFRTARPYS